MSISNSITSLFSTGGKLLGGRNIGEGELDGNPDNEVELVRRCLTIEQLDLTGASSFKLFAIDEEEISIRWFSSHMLSLMLLRLDLDLCGFVADMFLLEAESNVYSEFSSSVSKLESMSMRDFFKLHSFSKNRSSS